MIESGLRAPSARLHTKRRRFLVASAALLAVLGVVLGVTFTADTGTTGISVSGSSASSLLFTIPSTGHASGFPAVTPLKYGTTVSTGTTAGEVHPSWSPVKNAAGQVSSGGDIALIDGIPADAGGATSLLVTMYVTNLLPLQGDYSSFAFPINVYSTANAGTSWSAVPSSLQYVTNTAGYLSFTLTTAANTYFEIAMDTGGSFYTVSTLSDTTHSLGPSFYFTVQALS